MIERRMPLKRLTLVAAAALAVPAAGHAQAPAAHTGTAAGPASAIVEVVAEDYAFDAPDAIPSGWTTFRLNNTGKEHHFIFLSRLPDGKTFDDYMVDIGEPFDRLWKKIDAGEIDSAEAGGMLGGVLPAWYPELKFLGGTGLLAPGGVTQTTLNLEPGTYVMECYMKTPEGEIHALEGMARPLTVTEARSATAPPEADISVTLSNFEIAVQDEIDAGVHTVAVHFAEHPEVGFGHDLHLARLDGAAEVAEIVPWMNWFNVQGLRNPAPATFVGGTHEMPVGYTAYFTVNLEPGRYAWVSESAPDRMLKEFTVR